MTQLVTVEHPCRVDGEWDHDWQFQDDSFDHEFGTEVIHYDLCERCGETKACDPYDYELDIQP